MSIKVKFTKSAPIKKREKQPINKAAWSDEALEALEAAWSNEALEAAEQEWQKKCCECGILTK